MANGRSAGEYGPQLPGSTGGEVIATTNYDRLQPTSLVSFVALDPVDNMIRLADCPLSDQQIFDMTADLSVTLNNIHKLVSESDGTSRKRKADSLHRKIRAAPANFEIGDYVMVAYNLGRSGKSKLRGTWHGPSRIVKVINHLLYSVEDFITHNIETVHAQRLKFYNDSSLLMTEDLLNQIAHDADGFLIDRLPDLRLNPNTGTCEVQVFWQGLEQSDFTREPVENLKYDVPVLLKQFLQARPADDLAVRLLSSLFSS